MATTGMRDAAPSIPSSAPPAPRSEVRAAQDHTYDQILKSSAVIGGSSALRIAIGVVRTKALAVLLGPSSFGLMGLYDSTIEFVRSVASLGISNSGVRQIAEAAGSGDAERVARTVVVLRRISIAVGTLGALPLLLFPRKISVLTFGVDHYAFPVALLSAAVFFRCVSSGLGALIQGMRRIADLAKVNILGSLYGALISIPMVYFLRESGIVPSLVGVAAMILITSWWYAGKVRVSRPAMTAAQVGLETSRLLKLGLVFMSSSLMMMGSAYLIRIIVLRSIGFEALGYYQAAWSLSGLYVSFILEAMGTDFYPRLTGVVTDHEACNRVVNEQARISLLLAGPGVLATLTFAPVVIALFYSPAFAQAVDVLRWICVGMALRVITWPMGYIIVAQGAQNVFFLTDLAWTVVYLGLVWTGVGAFGLNGVGMAFFGSYVFHGLLIYPIVRRRSGFRWTSPNLRTGSFFLALIAAVFWGFHLLPPFAAYGCGALAVLLSGVYSVRTLVDLVSTDRLPDRVLTLLAWLGLVRRQPC
jgi:antigen flippase